MHLQLTVMPLDQRSERVPVPGARPPEQFRRHVATSISIVPCIRYRHRQRAELVALGPTERQNAGLVTAEPGRQR